MCEYQGKCWNKFGNVPINVLDCLACINNEDRKKSDNEKVEQKNQLNRK